MESLHQNDWASPAEFVRHRTLIEQLYEKQSLASVKKIMEREHDFRATSVTDAIPVEYELIYCSARMYKTRIKQWGLDKKNKEGDMRAIVRKEARRSEQGRRSVFRVRGKVVDFERVLDYWSRRGISIENVLDRQTASATLDAVECLSPVPSRPMTPDLFAIPERILQAMQNYYTGSFETGTWISTSEQSECYTTRVQNSIISSDLSKFYSECQHACHLFDRGSFQEAGQILIYATGLIKRILLAEHPRTLSDLVALVLYIDQQNRRDIALAILRQFSALGNLLLGDGHPLRRISGWLPSVDESQYQAILTQCLRSTGDHFEQTLGPLHSSTIRSRLEYIEHAYWKHDMYQATFALHDLLGTCDRTLSFCDVRILEISISLGYYYKDKGAYSNAETVGIDIVARSRCIKDGSDSATYQVGGLYVLATAQHALDKRPLAEANLRQAIDLTMGT